MNPARVRYLTAITELADVIVEIPLDDLPPYHRDLQAAINQRNARQQRVLQRAHGEEQNARCRLPNCDCTNKGRRRYGSVVMSGARHRQKGDRIERELVERHHAIGVHAERYPLSGASRFRGSGHDLDLYPFGREEAPIVAESKARKNGEGFTQLETWLADYDVLFLRRNNADPMVVLPWRVWAALLAKIPRGGAA